jgi:hypothetical protein
MVIEHMFDIKRESMTVDNCVETVDAGARRRRPRVGAAADPAVRTPA